MNFYKNIFFLNISKYFYILLRALLFSKIEYTFFIGDGAEFLNKFKLLIFNLCPNGELFKLFIRCPKK